MYIDSWYIAQSNPTTYTYRIQDSCFSSIAKITVPYLGFGLTIFNTLEACVVAHEYYRRNLNVARNLAAHYLHRRGGGYVDLADKRYHAYRRLMDDKSTINQLVPQLNFFNKYYKNTVQYLLHSQNLKTL